MSAEGRLSSVCYHRVVGWEIDNFFFQENDHFFKENFTLLRKNTLKSEIMNGFLFSDRDYKRCFYIVKKVFREKSEIICGPRLYAARL